MGGFAHAIGEGIGKLVSKVAPDLVKEASPLVMRSITENIAPMERSFMKSGPGKIIAERMQTHYMPGTQHFESVITQAAQSGKPHLSTQGANLGTPLLAPHDIRTEARFLGRKHAFGENDSSLIYLLNAAKGEAGDIHANVLSDHLGVEFHDQAYTDSRHRHANNLSRNITAAAKGSSQELEEGEHGAFIPKNQAPYKAPTRLENLTRKLTTASLAPHAAVPHAAGSIITLMADGVVPYTKALYSAIPFHTYEGSRTLLKITNAVAEQDTIEYNQHWRYEQSKFKGVLNSKFPWVKDSVGEIIHSNLMMPGMSGVRKWNLTVAGMSAKFHVEEMAARLMSEAPGGRAHLELQRYKINPDKIKAQGGHLMPEDLRTAIVQGTDYSAFLDGTLHRSRSSQASMMGRTMLAFHGYTSRSRKAIQGSIWRDISQGNIAGIATSLGALAVIAPEVGNGLDFIENTVRGKNLQGNTDEWKENERAMTPFRGDGFVPELEARIQAISHIAAFGVATGYTRSLARHKFAESLLGPSINMGSEIVQDIMQARKFFMDNKHPDALKQVGRDLIRDTPSMGLGGPLSHQVFPTRSEVSSQTDKTAKQMRAERTRARSAERKAQREDD